MKYQYIIWDWNGTIMDDVEIALDAVNDMLSQWHRPAISLQEYRKAMDTPIIHFYEHFFNMKVTSFEWIAARFHEYYAANQERLSLHEGVLQQLEKFHQAGCRQFVLSSSATDIIGRYATSYGIHDYFETILGADNLLSESKIQRAVTYCKEQQIDLTYAVLVGDTVHDYEVARELGVDCVLLACGHQDRESLTACGCPVYDCVSDWTWK